MEGFAKILRADVAELVDAPDLKSVEHCARGGSIPPVGTLIVSDLQINKENLETVQKGS